ncbi:MAG TPA: cation diffusion facilitator family transporter [Chloroflexota bacterium]
MTMDDVQARREKQLVTLTSVAAAMLLTVAKLAVGLATGSLGLLAEAAHSGLDLVAALLTLFAVRLADKPADPDHPYGHGKVENLSALLQCGLLVATAGWIIYEAFQRLFVAPVEIDASVWAFLVVVLSIVVDASRSRALRRAARRYRSQALEADALHFRTDIWSSAVVLLGLGLVQVGHLTGNPSLWGRADAVAAILVALVVLVVSGRLARQTVDALVDRAPEDLVHRVAEVASGVPGVLECERVRLRRSGPRYFADLVVRVARTTTFAQAHGVSEAVEAAVQRALPNADVLVHVEPVVSPEESAADEIHFQALQMGLRVRDVRVRQVEDSLEADLHVELQPDLPLADAHDLATQLERQVEEANPAIRAINTHLEAPEPSIAPRQDLTTRRAELVARVRDLTDEIVGAGSCHEVRVYGSDTSPLDLVIHCTFPPHLPIQDVHARSSEVERHLRKHLPNLGNVLVHAEPAVR